MKATQYPWYKKKGFKGNRWKVTLASYQKEVPMATPIPNSKSLTNMEIELLWDYFNKKDSNFKIDEGKIIHQIHG